MIPLRIVVRTNTPWHSMTMADFIAQKEPQKPTEFIRLGRTVLPIWERATGLSFFEYRDTIRMLCEQQLKATGIPVTVGIENIDWDSDDEGLIPIDDDDIILSSVASVSRRFASHINLVLWERVTNYLGDVRTEEAVFGGQIDTCNSAIRKSFLKQLSLSDRILALSRHWFAARVFAPLLGGTQRPRTMFERAKASLVCKSGIRLQHPSVLEVPEQHSIYFLHSGSISFLCHKMKQVNDIESYLRSLPLHPLLEGSSIEQRRDTQRVAACV